MKLLLDANISWKLVNKLIPIFGECAHVDYIGLNAPVVDLEIWNYAHKNDFIIVTKDQDFLDLLDVYGYPPKVVLIRTGNNSSHALFDLMVSTKEKIEELVNNNLGLLEIIKRT